VSRSILRAAAAVLLVPAALACGSLTRQSGRGDPLPRTIHACETNTATLCANWVREGNRYTAEWSQGSRAEIRVAKFDHKSIVFIRDDPSGTSAGMHAVYVGIPDGNTVRRGTVTWSHRGQTIIGRWTAEW
jgi:hypothetical protein